METSDLLTLLAVGAFVAGILKGVNSMVGARAGAAGWRGVFYVTIWLHPVLLGALFGLPNWFPAPHFMGDAIAGRVIWYGLSGMFSSTAYDAISTILKHVGAVKERNSIAPPANDGGEVGQ